MKIRILFHCLIGFLALLISPCATQAQEAPGMPLVKSIEVQFVGPASVSKEKILANMRTRVGRPYSPRVTEEDVRNLMATGNATNVRMFGEPEGNGVKVIVVVATKSTLAEVLFNGNTKVKTSKLRDQISSKPGDPLSESTLEADRNKIIEYYQGKNYGDVDVRYRTENVAGKAGAVRVIFDVTEGGKAKIDHVAFEGNTSVKRGDLMKVIKTKPKGLMSIFSSTAGKLNSDQLQDDVRAIRDLYQEKGFLQVEVRKPVVTRSGSKVDVTFFVVEGRQFHVGRVSVSGERIFAADEITQKLKLKPGAIYSPQALAADKKTISDLYGTKGYLDMVVIATPIPASSGTVDVSFRIEEGVQYYVDKVNIAGNTRTKDKVIRRELALAPGDLFNTVRMDASKARLENLRYFSRTEVRPAEPLISVPGRRDLDVDVTETQTGSFNFGAGFSSVDNLLGFVELTQGNFDIFNWPHLTGGGQKFRIRVQYGTTRKDFIISLTEPYFLDKKLSLGTELYYRDASYTSSVYNEQRFGGDIFLRRPINEFTALRLEYKLEEIKLHDFATTAPPEIIAEEYGKQWLKSQVSAGITYDSRNRVYLPSSGMRVDAQMYVAGGFLGGNEQIYGFDIEASKYISLPGDTILTFEGQIAGVDSWGGSADVPIFDRLYLGGANNLRGFTYREVGPKDKTGYGEPVGGKSLARATVEYTIPIIEKVRAAFFYDIGFVSAGAYQFNAKKDATGSGGLNSDYGIGLLLEIPSIGPIRIDYGIPLQSDKYNDSSGKFQFNIGYKF
ncbi:MAG: outer membrane protein assembly factor BamA [Chthoniobacteraceae bacterium]